MKTFDLIAYVVAAACFALAAVNAGHPRINLLALGLLAWLLVPLVTLARS